MSTIAEFIKVKKAIKQPSKDSTNPQFKSGYVSLDGIIKAIDDAIKETDANLVWWQEIFDNLIYTVISDGESEPLKIQGFPLIAVQMNKVVATQQASPQALGSGLTYAKRYSLATAFGISSEVDDDGNGSQMVTNGYQNNTFNSKQKTQSKSPSQNKSDKRDFITEARQATSKTQLKKIYDDAEEVGKLNGNLVKLLGQRRIELSPPVTPKEEIQGDLNEDLQKATQKPKGENK